MLLKCSFHSKDHKGLGCMPLLRRVQTKLELTGFSRFVQCPRPRNSSYFSFTVTSEAQGLKIGGNEWSKTYLAT